MFLRLKGYHRARDLSEALALLTVPHVRVLAGGTATVGPVDATTEALVDLNGLGLSYIDATEATVAIGAMTTLDEIAESPVIAGLGSGTLCTAALQMGPQAHLSRATVGGTLAQAGRAGELIAVLLALDARVHTLRRSSESAAGPVQVRESWDLHNFLHHQPSAGRKSLIEEVQIPTTPVYAALERVSRTPRDEPVVSVVVAVKCEGATCRMARIVACGLTSRPVRLPDAEAGLLGGSLTDEQLLRAATTAGSSLKPRADLRGGTEYRRHLARVLVRRALQRVRALAFAGGEE